MRAYSESKDFQQSYLRQKGKGDYFSPNREEARTMNGAKSACKKYISVVSEGNYFIASKAPLPDRIELRMCGTSGNLGQSMRSLSIPDLYRVKMKPIPEVVEETVDAVRREDVRAEIPCLMDDRAFSPNDGTLKEMYVSQYNPYFDPNAPRSHIGGWKVDMEHNGIPHHRPQMSTVYNPIVYEATKKVERPKSAPPSFAHEEDIFADDNDDDRLSSATLPTMHQNYSESVRSNDELTSRLRELWIDPPTPEYTNDDRSSLGYDPGSDDASETSSAFNSSGKRDPAKFSYSRPKLIRLSADFPGVRNLEKMRRKRQSMGSSSTGSMSSTSLSPSAGEYGFFVALTSKDKAPLPRYGRHYSMT